MGHPSALSIGDDAALLVASIQELSQLRDLPGVIDVVRRRARELTGADGVTFVLREKDNVFYADENAIGPLWKGQRFPANACISGWAMLHREAVAIEDIYSDPRIPVSAYRPTFVKSLLMMPIRQEDPIGAIGAYWAERHRVTEREQRLLQALANSTAIAITNAELFSEAKAAVRQRDEFLSMAAHELRTPITSLRLLLQSLVLQLDTKGTADLHKLRIGERSTIRLSRLIDDMLDVSRIASGRIDMTLHAEDADFAAIAREVVQRFREPRLNYGSEIDLRSPEHLVGHWDPTRLEQIVTNLLSNACKYGQSRPITITVEQRGDVAVLTVQDQGIGICADDRRRIFEPFERAVALHHYGGLGLGLFITRTLVEAHGGKIQVDSEPGRGSTFTVELPFHSPT